MKVRLELVNYYGAMIVCITTDLFLSNGQNWRVAALGNGQSSLITSQFRYGYFDGYENIPRADKYYDTATYTSVVHNAGINSPIYDIFETDYNANGQTTSFYVRSGITEANCRSDTWYQAINGYATTGLGNYQFTQFKVNMSTGDITISPIVNAVKQNYSGNTTVIDAPQAGIWYKNRYWISSASQAHSYNDEFLLKDRNGAWTRYVYKDSKGDWAANCFTLYQDRFLCGDSRYAIIWELETGNNDNGDIIPFYYYTKPLNFGLAGYRKNIVGANASSKGDTATLSYSCDDDLHWTNVVIPYNRNLTNNILTLYNIPYFKIIQFLISGETLNPWFIRDIFLYYSSSERPQQ